jgi:hypothetical protein
MKIIQKKNKNNNSSHKSQTQQQYRQPYRHNTDTQRKFPILDRTTIMPPVLDPKEHKRDGLAFLGLSLTRHSSVGHADSITHQTAFDLNKVLDRDYDHIFSTNDDGWLVGGGEPGPPTSYKLAAKDSAHVEIMRIGTYKPEWGGLSVESIVQALQDGAIFIPEIQVLPTAVVANPDTPPELEIRFDMQDPVIPVYADILNITKPLPINWELRFLHNQLFRHFEFPSRFCPGAFHSTILRKAEFRSPAARTAYFDMCATAVAEWKATVGPQSLVVPESGKKASAMKNITQVRCAKETLLSNTSSTKEDAEKDVKDTNHALLSKISDISKENYKDYDKDDSKMDGSEPTYSENCQSGIWLFTDRENITHQFLPNFLPPYDTLQKREVIWSFLKDEWNEEKREWGPVGVAGAAKTDAGQEPSISVGAMLKEMVDYARDACGPKEV